MSLFIHMGHLNNKKQIRNREQEKKTIIYLPLDEKTAPKGVVMLELCNKIYFRNKSKEKSSKKSEKVRPEKHLVVHPYW